MTMQCWRKHRASRQHSCNPIYFASGSGRSWKCTTSGLEPLPFSISHGARSPLELHNPRPFQPAFGSSMRPSKPLA